MKEEAHELSEHAEHARDDSSLAPVSLTMAILAVCVAAVSLLGHRAHTEELLLQNKASDQWAYYQAKNIRRHTYEFLLDFLAAGGNPGDARAAAVRKKYKKEVERYKEEQKEIEAEAKNFEAETGRERKKADRFDLGEGILEVALVISSITLMTRRRIYWFLGMVLGVLGLAVAASGLLVR